MKRAYHRLVLPDGQVHHMVVCEMDADGAVVAWHKLQGEEPNVEWMGGELNLIK
ncbi:MAG: hypothetical protein HUK02_09710 [Bacteroidaceae bacterium]|nr:hypothetical protein [Bacteroidaceae bacterium]